MQWDETTITASSNKLSMDKLKETVRENVAILAFSYVPSETSVDLFALTPAFLPTPSFNPHRATVGQVFDFIRKLQ